MPRKLPPGCVEDVDRYGNVRIYLRRKGERKIRLHGTPWSPDFMAEYGRILGGGAPQGAKVTRMLVPHTWRWLCQQYMASAAFKDLDAMTQKRRRSSLESTFVEPTAPGAATVFGDLPMSRMTPQAIAILRDRKRELPDGANNRLKAIRGVFKWACGSDVGLCQSNPARDVAKIQVATEGHHTWTMDEVDHYVARHPLGSKPYLAMALLMFAGGRRSDVVALGPQHISGGEIRYVQHKGRNSNPMTLEIPLLPDLRDAIQASVIGQTTFLVTSHGKPFTSNGFGNWFKDRCVEAGLPHCSAHGLRKAGATVAAENGATIKQLMAMFGWRTADMAELYTKKAERRRLARDGMPLIKFARNAVPLGPDRKNLLDFSDQKPAKSNL